jgi:uncharacterized protein
MQINHDFDNSAFAIRSYTSDEVTIVHPITERDHNNKPVVRQETLNHSIVVMNKILIHDWPVKSFETLQPEQLLSLIEYRPEVILLGTGNRIRFPDSRLTAPLLEQGIGVEIMDMAAACRTYNILMSEGRHVAAALIIES